MRSRTSTSAARRLPSSAAETPLPTETTSPTPPTDTTSPSLSLSSTESSADFHSMRTTSLTWPRSVSPPGAPRSLERDWPKRLDPGLWIGRLVDALDGAIRNHPPQARFGARISHKIFGRKLLATATALTDFVFV